MSLTVPLQVRLKTGRTDRFITRELRDLAYREVDNGGFASATFALDRGLSVPPDDLAHFARVYIYDNDETAWEGYVTNLGASADDDGRIWGLTALGPAAHARDDSRALYFVDNRDEKWIVGGAGGSTRHVNVTHSGETDPTITMRLSNGSVFSNGEAGLVVHVGCNETGQQLARIQFDWIGGTASSNLKVRLSTAALPAASAQRVQADLNTTGGTITSALGGTLPTGEDAAFIRFVRATSNLAVTDETIWAEFSNFVLRARLYDKDGSFHSGYGSNTVLASEIFADLLGRGLLPQYDGANAAIDTTTHEIDHLIYPDAVDSAKIIDDLLVLEPAFRWGAYESNAAGLYRVEFVARPTAVRYECDLTDGVDLPSDGSGIYNGARVRYIGRNSQRKTLERTSTVAVLDDAGLTRVADVDLGDEVGSSANAQRAGDEFLAEHATAPAGGTLILGRPVIDLIDGRMVHPSRIRAGQLIRLRGLQPRASALTASDRDGISTFRIASREFRTSDGAAVCELDQYSRSTARALAELAAATPKRRRRR
jgi:hypothetical protein